MKRLAIATCWVAIAANLYGAYQMADYGHRGILGILPMLLFGLTLVVHYGSYSRPVVVWIAFVALTIWGALGVVGGIIVAVANPPNVGSLFLFVCFVVIAPSVLNMVVLIRRVSAARKTYAV